MTESPQALGTIRHATKEPTNQLAFLSQSHNKSDSPLSRPTVGHVRQVAELFPLADELCTRQPGLAQDEDRQGAAVTDATPRRVQSSRFFAPSCVCLGLRAADDGARSPGRRDLDHLLYQAEAARRIAVPVVEYVRRP